MARRLIQLRYERPALELSEWIGRLGLRAREMGLLTELLKENSSCYSLWISMTSAGRTRHELYIAQGVADSSDDQAPQEPDSIGVESAQIIQFQW